MASRFETLQAKLMAAADWALVIVDEAHRMAANLSVAKSNIPSATNWGSSSVRRDTFC